MTDTSSTDQYDPATLTANLADVRRRMDAACARAGRRADEVTLVAVSKTHPASAIRTLHDAGQRVFGESYVQEWQAKHDQLAGDASDAPIAWHFIGHLQSNKAKYIVDDIAVVHSVDRRSVMKTLDKRAVEPVDVLLQVNVADQDTKSGVDQDGLVDLVELAGNFPGLRVRGLMAIPPYVDDPEDNRAHFEAMQRLFEDARAWLDDHNPGAVAGFEHLSMGMSGDFEVAIEQGATIVRVGTAIFGKREYDQ